ncbi:hypothetical protein HK104_009233 [Borealophlyctis nickersoniae]|nr:hypothetical protein HK104_009233 [Borealophlyctis nickersoniae]
MDGALQELLTLQKRQAKDLEELKTAVRMSGNPVKQTRTYQPLGANRGTSVRGAVRIGARGGETEREDKALQTDPERRDDQNGLAASQDPKKSVEPVDTTTAPRSRQPPSSNPTLPRKGSRNPKQPPAGKPAFTISPPAAVVGKSRTGLKLRDKALDATVARELGESDKRLARSWKRAMKEVEEERKRSRRPPYVRRKSAVKEQKSGGDARGGKDTKIIKSNPAQSESAWLEEELVKFRRQLAEEAEQFRVRRSIGKENTEENRDTHELESLTPPPMTPVDQSPEPSVESHSTPQPATPPSVNTQPPQSVAPTEPVLTDEIFKYVNELFAQRIEPLLARAREEIGTSNPGLPSGALEVLRDKLPQARSLESLLREGAPEVDDHVAGEADGAVPAGGNAVDVVGRAEEADRPVQPPTTSDQTKQTAPSTPSSSTSKKRPNPPFETLIMDGFQSAAPTSSHEPLKPDDHPPRIQTSPPIDDDPPPFGLALPDPVINRVMTGQSAYFQHLRDALRLPSNAADFNGEGSMDPTPWDVIERYNEMQEALEFALQYIPRHYACAKRFCCLELSIADDLLEEVLDLNAAELDGFADDFVERLFREEFFPADQSGADMEM